MTIVHPAGMIQNRIKTNPVNRHSTRDGRLGFLADITKPARARAVFRPGFRNEDWPMIALKNFGQHFAKRPIGRMMPRDRREPANAPETFEIIEPLVVRIKI